jgi:hypothetical protein
MIVLALSKIRSLALLGLMSLLCWSCSETYYVVPTPLTPTHTEELQAEVRLLRGNSDESEFSGGQISFSPIDHFALGYSQLNFWRGPGENSLTGSGSLSEFMLGTFWPISKNERWQFQFYGGWGRGQGMMQNDWQKINFSFEQPFIQPAIMFHLDDVSNYRLHLQFTSRLSFLNYDRPNFSYRFDPETFLPHEDAMFYSRPDGRTRTMLEPSLMLSLGYSFFTLYAQAALSAPLGPSLSGDFFSGTIGVRFLVDRKRLGIKP